MRSSAHQESSRRIVAPGDLERELINRQSRAQALRQPRTHRRLRKLRLLGGLGATAMLLLTVGTVFAVHDEDFQLDGNTAALPVNPAPFDGTLDWESLFHDNNLNSVGGTGTPVTTLVGDFVDADFVEDWGLTDQGSFVTSDPTTFTQSKDDEDIDDWRCVQSNQVTNKGDITNAYAGLAETSSGRILYFGMEKGDGEGDNNVALWVVQDPDVGCNDAADGDLGGNGDPFSGIHTVGDLFIVSAFTNGGGVSTVDVYAWDPGATIPEAGVCQDSDASMTCIASGVDCADTNPGDDVCATTNLVDFEPQWDHFSGDNGVNGPLEPATFLEGGINLDAFEEFEGECFTGFLFNTRSSQEITATLFDYALGDIDTCNPELSLDKEPETQTHNVGDSFNWTLTVSNTGDQDAEDAVVSDTIPDGLDINSATVNPPAAGSCDVTGQDIECEIDVPIGGSVTITVNVTSTLDVFEEDEGCVDVNNTGTVTIDGDSDTSDNSDTVEATICRPLVEKTAAGDFTHDVQWDIEKSVDITQHTLLAGETGTSTYTVSVDKTVTDSDFDVTGTITIENPSPEDNMTVDVTDALSSGEAAAATDIDCGVAGDGDNLVVPFGESVVCTYGLEPADADPGTNTATVTLNSINFTATAPYTFTPTNTGDPETVNVTDNFDGGGATAINGPVSDDTTFDTYTHDFPCPTDETLYDSSGHYQDTFPNTAEIVETDDEDSESVDLDCYIPLIEKDAAGSFTHGVDWTIEKSVAPDQHTMLAGESDDSTYTVSVDKTVTDSNFHVAGTITISNPSPEDDMTVDVTDELSSGETAAATDIDCETSGGGLPDEDGDNVVVPAGESIDCFYAINTTDATPGTNTATATFSDDADVEVSDDAGYTFTATNEGEPEEVNVTDNFNNGGAVDIDTLDATPATPVGDDASWTYDRTFTCPTDETLYVNGHYDATFPNTAEIVETDDEDSASVHIDCYIPTIVKTADGSFDRDWDWTIEKTGSVTDLILAPGQSFFVSYTVTVDPTATDSEFEVTGSITVSNPSTEDNMTVDVTDMLSTGETLAATDIDCGAAGDGDNAIVPFGGSIVCTYLFTDVAGVADGDDGTNTATAAFSLDANVSVSDTDGYSYALDSETDECIDVEDTLGGVLGTVCADADPEDFVFEYTYDVVQEECGEHDVPNVASFLTSDQDGEDDDAGSDDWNVHITIDCPQGCTLTQGYWKTHSSFGPAPEDEVWLELADVDGDGIQEGPNETFFLSGKTWYQVFWTNPAGNAYYILAKQYMAAVLNITNGADSPANVDAAITSATTLFQTYTPAQIAALKGNKQPRPQFISLAGTLGSYNEGTIGPGHCDEDANSSRVQ